MLKDIRTNGTTLSVSIEGAGDPLLCIHGYPLDRRIWDPLTALRGWQVIAPDLRGFGRSPAPPGLASMTDYAMDLEGVLDDLGFDRVVLAGLSMGGYVAFECLRRWPGRVRAVALLATRAAADSPAAREKRLEAIRLVEQGGVESISASMVPQLLSPGAPGRDPGLVERVRDITMRASVPGIAAALEAMRQRPDSTSLLKTLTEPVLVLAGEADQVIPLEESRAMADAARQGTFEVIPGAGHLLTLEAPDHTVRAMQTWLDREVEGRRSKVEV